MYVMSLPYLGARDWDVKKNQDITLDWPTIGKKELGGSKKQGTSEK
jgi:hypothetical protein